MNPWIKYKENEFDVIQWTDSNGWNSLVVIVICLVVSDQKV